MTKSMSTLQTPFQNLKFLIMINKVLGLISSKLVNGRFKQSSIWNCCYCVLWILLHCTYSGVYYYMSFVTSHDEETEKRFALSIVRFSAFFISLLPYNYVAAFRSKDYVKYSNKLEIYDDKVTALGYPRKDKHIFIWLYFVYTFSTITVKSYFNINNNLAMGTMTLIKIIFETIIPIISGTYCVFITGILLDLIRQRFRHLNEVIVPHVSELPVTGSQDEITIYNVRYLHGVLINAAELINTLYGMATLLTFGSILLEFVSIIYISITDSKDDPTVFILDLLFQVIFLFAIYHFTTSEANRVEDRVVRYGLSFQNDKCRMDKIEMMLYFYHRRYTFTAAGFFVVDLAIFLPIASTVATYITLLM